jgi:prepilin-type N-terminal cleavage/methylation domain-containing protein
MKRAGFTLIELLVVIAIIALLLSVMVPSLRIAKEYAAAAVCLTNQKNLCLAWTMYAEDNKSLLVGGSTYSAGHNKPTPYRWTERPLNYDTDNADTNNTTVPLSMETRINGIRAGKLFPYTQDPELYHCPADRTFVKNPEPLAVYRSYAIGGLMNGEDFAERNGGINAPISRYRVVGNRTLRVATKMNQITSPGSKFVFVEEDVAQKGQQWNAGGFVLMEGGNAQSWWDWPAYFHNDSSTLGFADGHGERIRWQDSRTIRLMKEGETPDNNKVSAGLNNEDLQFLIRGYFPMP